MRIAFIGQKGIPVSQWGVERHVEEIAKRLANKGHEVLVYSRETYPKGKGVLPPGVKVLELPSIPLKAWDTIVHSFLASIDVLFRKVDIIHFQSQGPAIFVILPKIFKRSAKVVFTFHCDDVLRPQWGLFAKLALRMGEWIGMKFADEVISASAPVFTDRLVQKYGRKVNTIPNGVFLAQADCGELRLPENYILAVSRLIRSKGLDHLINAFNLISKDYPNCKLLIVGSPTLNDNDKPRLQALASGNDHIIFMGHQPSNRLFQIFQNAEVFVQPSEIEGLPMTLLEAASVGIPVIASDIAEHTSVLKDFGIYFKSKNYIDLAIKLRQVLDNKESLKVKAAEMSQMIAQDYSWDSVADKVNVIYSGLGSKNKVLKPKLA